MTISLSSELYIYFSFYLSNLPIDLFIDSSIYSFTYLSICLPVYLPIYLSFYLSTYLSIIQSMESIIDHFIHVLIICIYLLFSLASILSNYTCILNRNTDTRFHLQWQKLTPPTKVVPHQLEMRVSHEAPKKWPKNTWLAHLAEIKTSQPWEDQHSFSICWDFVVSNERCDLTLAIVGLGYA